MVLRLAALLPEYGYRVSILTFSANLQSGGLNSATCPIYLLPLKRTYDLRALCAAIEFRRFLRVQRIQIVQTFFESSDLWAGLMTRMLSKAKLVWGAGIWERQNAKTPYILSFYGGYSRCGLCSKRTVRQRCVKVDGITPSRVHTVYNGLDLAVWKMAFDPNKYPGELRVITAGNIRRVKGHDVLIKAAALIVPRFPKASFIVAGNVLEQDYFAELEALVLSLNLSDHFHFIGEVADVQSHLCGADVFVLPSRSEGFSNAIVEAMAASLPVVATDVGGNAEAVKNCVSGFIVPPKAGSAAAIERLFLRRLSQARVMGMAGRALASEKFSVEAMMKQIMIAYKNLIPAR